MRNSKKSELQKPANAATKPNTDTKQGVCNKEKFALWAYPDTMKEVSAAYENDNCKSKSEFIEKAIRFYLGYIKQERNVNYLSPRITSQMNATIAGMEQRLSRNLFKIAVELGKLSHMIAVDNNVDDDTLRELHAIVRALNKFNADEVRHINGCIYFESAVRFQNDEED